MRKGFHVPDGKFYLVDGAMQTHLLFLHHIEGFDITLVNTRDEDQELVMLIIKSYLTILMLEIYLGIKLLCRCGTTIVIASII